MFSCNMRQILEMNFCCILCVMNLYQLFLCMLSQDIAIDVKTA